MLESPPSPSPTLYAPRRSLDPLYDEGEDEDEFGGGGEWLSAARYYLWEEGPPGAGAGGVARRVRKRTQPSSFLYGYSTLEDVKEIEDGDENLKDKDMRGRGSEHALVALPLGTKEKGGGKKDLRGKSRKGASRAIFGRACGRCGFECGWWEESWHGFEKQVTVTQAESQGKGGAVEEVEAG